MRAGRSTIQKLAVASGKPAWRVSITKDPTHEKIASSLNYANGDVIATTGGYIGDIPPYQGHLVTLRAADGTIAHVFNALCSDRRRLLRSGECPDDGAAMWARSGAAVDPKTGDLVVATGNGAFDGKTSWGDSLLVLSPDGSKLLRHWTPANQEHLNELDLDLGASGPGLLPGGYVVQGGKDRRLHLVSPAMREVQTVATPGGGPMWTVPATQGAWVYAATYAGTQAWRLRRGKLVSVWRNRTGGSSPVVAGGLLYVAGDGALAVYLPATGKLVARLPFGSYHWQTPVIADGRIALADGDNNAHRLDGELNVYTAAS